MLFKDHFLFDCSHSINVHHTEIEIKTIFKGKFEKNTHKWYLIENDLR